MDSNQFYLFKDRRFLPIFLVQFCGCLNDGILKNALIILITFKNSKELQETFRFIPLDRLLIETDSPYLAPEPHRGKKNEPSFVIHTAEKLANLKNLPSIELINKTSLNFDNLFN